MRCRLIIFLYLLTCVVLFDAAYPDERSTETLNIENYFGSEETTEADFVVLFDQSDYNFTTYSVNPEINFSAFGYRRRGYDYRFANAHYRKYYFTDPSDGSTFWNLFQYPNNIHNRNGTRFSTALSNLSYSNRFSYTGNYTLGNNTNLGFAADRRWGGNGYVEGLRSELNSGAFIFGKNFGRHNIEITYSGHYGRRDVRTAVTQEVYDLADDNYYNPLYGEQNGKVRNARRRNYAQNFAGLDYSFRITPRHTLDISVKSFFGEEGYVSPTWYDAMSPYPDYYRYLPDFYSNSLISDQLHQAWRDNDPSVKQINWKRMYETNLYGSIGNDGARRAHYIMAESVKQFLNNTVSANLTIHSSEVFSFRAEIEIFTGKLTNFACLDDLLGGDYWLDIDQFILYDEYYGDKAENDIRNPGRQIREGEKFGYNYNIYTDNANVNIGALYSFRQWKLNGALTVGRTSYQRKGNYEKENFPDNGSFGRSVKKKFNEYDLRISAGYTLSLRHYLEASAWLAEKAPFYTEIFYEPRYRNHTIDQSTSGIKIHSVELTYRYISPILAVEVTGYYTRHKNGNNIFNYYDDPLGQYVTLSVTNIDKVYSGVELTAEYNPTPRLSLAMYAAVNIAKYNSDAAVEISDYNSGVTLLRNGTSMLSGYRLGNGPQSVMSVEARYTFPQWWRLGVSLNYVGDNYVSVNPVRRMTRITDVAASQEILAELLEQEKLDDAFTVNVTLSKNFRLKNGSYIGLWGVANNILNRKDIRYTGYEQMRLYRTSNGSNNLYYPFPSRYLYAYGINFNITLSYGF
ncbi:MAG: hypothetical protein LIO79_07330 [Rikenellaceae bacterium]|nr:hypothetical protein [Rikenellaceae bacterium]